MGNWGYNPTYRGYNSIYNWLGPILYDNLYIIYTSQHPIQLIFNCSNPPKPLKFSIQLRHKNLRQNGETPRAMIACKQLPASVSSIWLVQEFPPQRGPKVAGGGGACGGGGGVVGFRVALENLLTCFSPEPRKL